MSNEFTREEKKAFCFGLFAFLTFIILFTVMAFSKDGYKHVDENFYYLKASFRRTDGLLVGDSVRMAGIDIGRVVDAKLDEQYNAVLNLEIKDGILIPDDSSASIVSSSIMGKKYIEIEPGGSEEFLKNNDEFSYTQDAMVLQELLDRIIALAKSKKKKNPQNIEEENIGDQNDE